MGWFRELRVEWRARREGRRYVTSHVARVTRDLGGAGTIGHRGLRVVDKGGGTYVRSFDRRLPPSIFVSERDRRRSNLPIPVAERCLEELGSSRSADEEISR